jgi:hypothetical protein
MRTEQELLNLRPNIATAPTTSSPEEGFQNEVLRPILKYQHDLLLKVMLGQKNYQRGLSSVNGQKEQLDYTRHYIQQNKTLRHIFIGIVLGIMTEKELYFYFNFQKVLNKRILDMIAVRLTS